MYIVEQVKNCRRINGGNRAAVLDPGGPGHRKCSCSHYPFQKICIWRFQGLFAGSEQNVSTIFISLR